MSDLEDVIDQYTAPSAIGLDYISSYARSLQDRIDLAEAAIKDGKIPSEDLSQVQENIRDWEIDKYLAESKAKGKMNSQELLSNLSDIADKTETPMEQVVAGHRSRHEMTEDLINRLADERIHNKTKEQIAYILSKESQYFSDEQDNTGNSPGNPNAPDYTGGNAEAPGENDSGGDGSTNGPSNGGNPGGGYDHFGSGTTTGDFNPPGEWEGGNGSQSHGTPEPGLPENPDYTGVQPLVVDLDRDGVEISFDLFVSFDWDFDGYQEQTSWASSDDGFLVLDLNSNGTRGSGDGKIDQARELAFSLWGNEGDTDLQALARAFDDTNDNILNAQDAVWSELKIWQDLDQDGETDTGELKTLSAWGITQINLTYDDNSTYSTTTDDITVFGNTLHGLSSYVRNGETVSGGVGDMTLSYNTLGWRRTPTDIGFSIEFESGAVQQYAVLGGSDSATLDLVAGWLDGASGDDRNNNLTASGHTRSVQIAGGAGNDTLIGGQLGDYLSGDAGFDQISGGAGNDVVFFDHADINSVNAHTSGGAGIDTAIYTDTTGLSFDLEENGFERAVGGGGNDTLTAEYDTTSVVLHGREGQDLLRSGDADDLLSGGEGNDTLYARAGDDFTLGGIGQDHLNDESGDDRLLGGKGHDDLDSLYFFTKQPVFSHQGTQRQGRGCVHDALFAAFLVCGFILNFNNLLVQGVAVAAIAKDRSEFFARHAKRFVDGADLFPA